MTLSPETAGGVDTEPVPVLKAGRCAHFTFPLSMSMANVPPRPVWLPARIVVPATVAGLQSLKPALTVSLSTGVVQRGWISGGADDCANPSTEQSATPPSAPLPRHNWFSIIIGALFLF